MYSFNEDVYLVRGKTNACFYDLRNERLIQCSSDYADVAELAIQGQILNVVENINPLLVTLLSERLLISNPYLSQNTGDISKLKENTVIDFAWIEITNQCNMRCIHCYDEANEHNSVYMSMDDFQHVIDELYKFGIKNIQLIGGEPLILQNIKEMIFYAKQKMESITIFTNGSLINDELARLFLENKIKIAVSVYSYDAKYHDLVTRVSGSYDRTLKGVELLKKYCIPYRVANVLMSGVEIGKRNTDLFDLRHKGDIVRLSGRANGRLLNDDLILKKLITQNTFCTKLTRKNVTRAVSGHNCFARRLYVAADMNVYPCVMERRITHGCLKNNSLFNIIQQSILEFNKDHIEGCKDCELRYACFDCRPNSITGNIKEKPWYCTYDPKSGKWESREAALNRIKSNLFY